MSESGQPEGRISAADGEVLALLEQDGRITPERIAEAIGRPVDDVRGTIARAERDGVILRYGALIDWGRAGREEVWAWVELKVTPEPETGFDAIAARIAKFPQTWSVYLTSGSYDLGVLVRAGTMHEVSDFVSQKLATLGPVQGTVSHFIMRRYKLNGVEFGRASAGDRLPVSF